MIELRPREPGYPRGIKDLSSPPDPLWLQGTLPDETLPHVAIVGTRRVTPYGTRIAGELATALASSGAVVVSGLAQGIDSVVHSAALAAGGITIAVLGEGLLAFEKSGPYRRQRLARAIRERGALLSEYGLDFGARTWTFPRRNATIAALGHVVVVVEAPIGSGALITADRALELGRPVYAVPGPLGASTWEGSNRYLAAGRALMLLSPADLAEPLGVRVMDTARLQRGASAVDRVLELLAAGPADADAIASPLGLSGSDAATLIADMLLAGSIIPTGDGRFARR